MREIQKNLKRKCLQADMYKAVLMMLLAILSGSAVADDSFPKGFVPDPYYTPKPNVISQKHSTIFSEQSREECWLDNMPGTTNDIIARQILKDCSKYEPYIGEKSNGWFGGKTVSWCVRKYGEDTVGEVASRVIYVACNKLYKK